MKIGRDEVFPENDAEVRKELDLYCQRRGAKAEIARTLNTSHSYIVQAIRRHRSMVPRRIAAILGYRLVVRWEKTGDTK